MRVRGGVFRELNRCANNGWCTQPFFFCRRSHFYLNCQVLLGLTYSDGGLLPVSCSGVTPGTIQGTIVMLGIKPGLSTCKTNTLNTVLSFLTQIGNFERNQGPIFSAEQYPFLEEICYFLIFSKILYNCNVDSFLLPLTVVNAVICDDGSGSGGWL